jgi:hypothetical protein
MAHHENEYLKKKMQMNLKGCLRSAQIFNAATPPINPISKGFPYKCSYYVLRKSARLLMTTTRCHAVIIITAREFIPCSYMSSDPTSSGKQLQLYPLYLNINERVGWVGFIHPFRFIFGLGIGHLGTHYYDEPHPKLSLRHNFNQIFCLIY